MGDKRSFAPGAKRSSVLAASVAKLSLLMTGDLEDHRRRAIFYEEAAQAADPQDRAALGELAASLRDLADLEETIAALKDDGSLPPPR